MHGRLCRRKPNPQSQRRAAVQPALRAYANDLAFKSQVALQRGDRTTAFQLAAFFEEKLDDLEREWESKKPTTFATNKSL